MSRVITPVLARNRGLALIGLALIAGALAIVFAVASPLLGSTNLSAPAGAVIGTYEDLGQRHGPEFLRRPAAGTIASDGYEDYGQRQAADFLRRPAAAPASDRYQDFGQRHGPEFLRRPAAGTIASDGYEDFGQRHGPDFLRRP